MTPVNVLAAEMIVVVVDVVTAVDELVAPGELETGTVAGEMEVQAAPAGFAVLSAPMVTIPTRSAPTSMALRDRADLMATTPRATATKPEASIHSRSEPVLARQVDIGFPPRGF